MDGSKPITETTDHESGGRQAFLWGRSMLERVYRPAENEIPSASKTIAG